MNCNVYICKQLIACLRWGSLSIEKHDFTRMKHEGCTSVLENIGILTKTLLWNGLWIIYAFGTFETFGKRCFHWVFDVFVWVWDDGYPLGKNIVYVYLFLYSTHRLRREKIIECFKFFSAALFIFLELASELCKKISMWNFLRFLLKINFQFCIIKFYDHNIARPLKFNFISKLSFYSFKDARKLFSSFSKTKYHIYDPFFPFIFL